MLPEFLIADNSQEAPDRLYVVHAWKPACIIECDTDDFRGHQRIHWLDEAPHPAVEIERLLEAAELFFEAELDNQEELYDREFE
jgi:hypothetical protein